MLLKSPSVPCRPVPITILALNRPYVTLAQPSDRLARWNRKSAVTERAIGTVGFEPFRGYRSTTEVFTDTGSNSSSSHHSRFGSHFSAAEHMAQAIRFGIADFQRFDRCRRMITGCLPRRSNGSSTNISRKSIKAASGSQGSQRQWLPDGKLISFVAKAMLQADNQSWDILRKSHAKLSAESSSGKTYSFPAAFREAYVRACDRLDLPRDIRRIKQILMRRQTD